MTETPAHFVTVILRRFPRSVEADVVRSNDLLREYAKTCSGFVGAEDSYLPAGEFVDLVTVYTFASREAVQDWESDSKRRELVDQLDAHCVEVSERATFDGLAILTPDSIKISKHETVVILIVLILLLGWLADLLLPPITQPWRTVVAVTVNVCLISYILLPWSARVLVWVKKHLRW